MAGLNKEVWLNLIKENFYPEFTFLNETMDMSSFVENDVINLAEAGVNPTVLKNNTSYPLASATRTDTALTLPLAYYDTETSILRDAEKAELAYDKMQSIVYGHKQALLLRQHDEGAFNYAPSADGANTPIVSTTGSLVGGFRYLTYADIAKAAQRLDAINVSRMNRIMVMDSASQEQLRNEDQVLYNQMMSHAQGGTPAELYGFKIYMYENLPLYVAASTKKAFGTTYSATDKYTRAVFWQKDEVMNASGTLKMFERLADPYARGDLVGFQQRFLALPIRSKGIGSIITATS